MRLPAGLVARRGRLLVAGSEAAFRQSGDTVELTVPSILAHEVVGIDTA